MNEKILKKLFKECEKVGYTRLSIGYRHNSIPDSISFPFGPLGSIFAWPTTKEIDKFPAIWAIVEKLKLNCGCGNCHQYQYKMDKLTETGVYHLKRGEWKKVFPKK